ncbi:MAG TPA: acetylglutamate kinase [Chloroflexota bacterium]|jgi:acetylglutamate kinase
MGRPVVIKLGGSVGPGETVLREVVGLRTIGVHPILVHGGGPLITSWLARIGKETRFIEGLRHTDAETLDVARMVLVGLVNTELVAQLGALGAKAVGLSGADGRLLLASVRDERLGFVGEVERVDTAFLARIFSGGYVPVIAPIAVSTDGQCLNVNADTVAGVVAAAIGAEELVFLTDVPGIQDAAGVPLARLTPAECAALAAEGVIHGGMLPKVDACRRAAEAGATSQIVDGRQPYALLRAICALESGGTVIAA